MKKKNILFSILLAIFVSCFVTFGITSVGAETVERPTFGAFAAGAAMRYDEDRPGLRFTLQLNKQEYESIVQDGEYKSDKILKVYVAPATYFENATLDEVITKAQSVVIAPETFYEENGVFITKVALVDILYQNTGLLFQAVAALESPEGRIFSKISDARSIAYVSSAVLALTLPEESLTEAQESITDSFVQKAIAYASGIEEKDFIADGRYSIAVETESALVLEPEESKKIKLNVTPAVDLYAKWESDNEAVVTVDENGEVTAVGMGTANITVTVYGETAEITVTVAEDSEKPVISLGKVSNGVVGNEYSMFDINVTDNSGETINPVVKVFFTGEQAEETGGEEITGDVTEMFTPTKVGHYRVEVSAEDSAGNMEKVTEYFHIGEENVVESFDNDLSRDALYIRRDFSAEKKTVLQEYQGKKGVLRFADITEDGWWQFSFAPRQVKAAYENKGYDEILMRFYIEVPEGFVTEGFGFINDGNDVIRLNPVPHNEWVDFIIPIETFLKYYDELKPDYGVGQCFGWTHDAENKAPENLNIYLDVIAARKSVEAEIVNGGEYAFEEVKENGVALATVIRDNGKEYATSATYSVTDETGRTIVAENGIFKPVAPGKYKIKAVISTDKYHAETEKEIVITSNITLDLSGCGIPVKVVAGEKVAFGQPKVLANGVPIEGYTVTKKVTYKNPLMEEPEELAVESEAAEFTAEKAGEYSIQYSAVREGMTFASEVVTITVEYASGARLTVQDFGEDGQINSFHPNATCGWQESVTLGGETKNGVGTLKMEGYDEWWHMTFKPSVTKADVYGYDKLTISLYIEIELPADKKIDCFGFPGDSNASGWKNWTGEIAVNQWITLELNGEEEIQMFYDVFDKLGTADYASAQIFGQVSAKVPFTIYFDSVVLSKV